MKRLGIALLLMTNVAYAEDGPVFKKQCIDLLSPNEYHSKYNETINIASEGKPIHAIPSKSTLNAHSSFNWLIRRLKGQNPTLELVKKGIRIKNPCSGGQVGWGVIEQMWTHVFENIIPFSHSLFEANKEQFSLEEQALVQRIFAVMHLKQDLKFVPENSKPGFFQQSGPHRAAITGSTPGSTIYINEAQTKLFDVAETKDKFTSPDGLMEPNLIKLSASTPTLEGFVSSTKKEKMANILGLLIHELGHHAGLKDTAERPLDQLGAKFERLALSALQDSDLGFMNQPWLRVRTFNPAAPSVEAVEGKTYFVEAGDLYDLTDEMKVRVSEKLKKSFAKVWTYNLRIEGPGTFDSSEFTTPVSFLADVVAMDANNQFTTVPVRLVAYVGPAQAIRWVNVREAWWQYTNGQLRKGNEEALLSIEVLADRAQSGVSVKPNPKLDISTASFTRKEYKPGETAEIHIEIPQGENLDLKSIALDLTSDDFVQSGATTRSTFTLKPSRLLPLANGTTVATFQWLVPGNVQRSLKMKVSRIYAPSANGIVNFRVANPLTFQVPGGKSKAKIISYGNGGRRVMGTIKAFPQPFLGFTTTAGSAIPIEFHFQSGAPLSLKISGTVTLQQAEGTQNSGFVMDLLSPENHQLIERKEIERRGGEVLARVWVRAPRQYNGQKVEHLFIKSSYLLDDKLDEVFENTVIGIKPE